MIKQECPSCGKDVCSKKEHEILGNFVYLTERCPSCDSVLYVYVTENIEWFDIESFYQSLPETTGIVFDDDEKEQDYTYEEVSD